MAWRKRQTYTVTQTLVFVGLCLLLGTACHPGQDGAGPVGAPREVTLHADLALRPLLEEVIDKFQRRSDVRIHAHYAPSHELIADFMADPDAVELLLLGDAYSLTEAVEAGHIADVTPTLALVRPVLLTQSGNPKNLESVADLQRPGLRVGLAHPASALGLISTEILGNYGLRRADLGDNLILDDVAAPALANAVRIGRLDAALMWESTARRLDRVALLELSLERDRVGALQLALSQAGSRSNAAREFVEFTGSRAMRDSLIAHHYLVGGASIDSAWRE